MYKSMYRYMYQQTNWLLNQLMYLKCAPHLQNLLCWLYLTIEWRKLQNQIIMEGMLGLVCVVNIIVNCCHYCTFFKSQSCRFENGLKLNWAGWDVYYLIMHLIIALSWSRYHITHSVWLRKVDVFIRDYYPCCVGRDLTWIWKHYFTIPWKGMYF